MAISIDYIRPWTQLEAIAAQTAFSTIWTADKATDILVYARAAGVEARDVDQLVSSNDYTVAFIGAGLTVQVTFLAGRTVGDVITIVRDTPADKMNLYSNTNFKPSMLNSDFERVVMMIQQSELYDKDLAPRYNTSETPYGVDENNPPNFNRVIDLYLPLLPPLHVWRKNAANTMIEAVLFGSGGEGGGGTSITIVQDTSLLYEGAWVRWDLITHEYILAMANNEVNAEVTGCVVSITDASNFILQEVGPNETTFPTEPEGIYFLSTTVAGGMTLSLPQNDDEVSVPVLDKTDGALGFVMNKRGKVIGSGGAGPGTGENEIIVVQPAHGLTLKQVVKAHPVTPGYFVTAQADTFANSTTVGFVTEVIDVNTFRLQTHGYTSAFGDTIDTIQYLSDSTPGALTNVRPTTSTSYIKPMLIGSTTGASFILEEKQIPVAVEDSNIVTLPQPGTPFVVGNWIRPTNAGDDIYALGLADTLDNSKVTGMVIAADASFFTLQTEGFTNALTGGVANGEDYWLSSTVAGDMTNIEPGNGFISKPVFKGSNATDNAGYILEQRPMIQPNANGGSSGDDWNFISEHELIAANNIDLPTIISANPQFRDFRVDYWDLYAEASATSPWFAIQVYIGGVLQVASYQSFAYNKRNIAVTPGFVSYEVSLTGAVGSTWYMSKTLAGSGAGTFQIKNASLNGSPKFFTNNIDYKSPAGGPVSIYTGSLYEANLSPLQGFKIGLSGGTQVGNVKFKVYGI